MSGSSPLLRSSREGSALFLLSLITAWENPCSPLLQSAGGAWQQALVGSLLGGLGCRMPGELLVSSSGGVSYANAAMQGWQDFPHPGLP